MEIAVTLDGRAWAWDDNVKGHLSEQLFVPEVEVNLRAHYFEPLLGLRFKQVYVPWRQQDAAWFDTMWPISMYGRLGVYKLGGVEILSAMSIECFDCCALSLC